MATNNKELTLKKTKCSLCGQKAELIIGKNPRERHYCNICKNELNELNELKSKIKSKKTKNIYDMSEEMNETLNELLNKKNGSRKIN